MTRGSKPKPAVLKVAQGDTRKLGIHKFAEKLAAEPKKTRGLPECPRHLRGRAREVWNFWREELHVMNIDNRPDAHMLEGACVAYQQAVQADEIIQRDGPIIEESIIDKRGEKVVLNMKAHPAVAISRSAWKQMQSFSSEFGLSPVSGARLAIEKRDDGQDLATLLLMPRVKKDEEPK
jgi:P27 family predicted phage terminase small subunit